MQASWHVVPSLILTSIAAQNITIAIDTPAPAPSSFRLPVITATILGTTFTVGSTPPVPADFLQVQAPTQGIYWESYGGGPTSGTMVISLPTINIPEIATSPIPLTIDVTGGLPALTLFPGGLSIPQNAIPLLIDASGVLDPITIFPGGWTIDPLPLSVVGAFGGLVWILSAEKAAKGSAPIAVPEQAQ